MYVVDKTKEGTVSLPAKELDFKRLKRLMKQPLFIDGRNIYDPKKIKALGFRYISIGR